MGKGFRPGGVYLVAFAGIGAALYYLLLWLPGIPVIGLPTLKMEIGASLAPLLGIILGPYTGALAVLIGNIAKSLYPPNLLGMLMIPCAPLSAFATAMLIRRNRWIPALILTVILIVSLFLPPFYPLTDYDPKLGVYAWQVYLLAFFDKIAALLLIPIALDLVTMPRSKYIGLYMLMFIGREVDKALGCMIFALPPVYSGLFGLSLRKTRSLFIVSPLFYFIEYLFEALIAMLIAIPVIKALLKVPGLSEILHVKVVRDQKIL
jgi:hypothetical protein